MSDSNAKVLFTIQLMLPTALEAVKLAAASGGANVGQVVVLDAAEADDSGAAPVVPYASLLSTGLTASPPPSVSISPSDIVVLPYSSGASLTLSVGGFLNHLPTCLLTCRLTDLQARLVSLRE